MMYQEMAIKKGCGEKSGGVDGRRMKDEESDIDGEGLRVLMDAFLMTHLP